jgi:hypothetical protein
MGGFFQRQLAVYVEYHRDPRNTAMHVVGLSLPHKGGGNGQTMPCVLQAMGAQR